MQNKSHNSYNFNVQDDQEFKNASLRPFHFCSDLDSRAKFQLAFKPGYHSITEYKTPSYAAPIGHKVNVELLRGF